VIALLLVLRWLRRYLQPAAGAIFDVGIIAFRVAAVMPVIRRLGLRLDLHNFLPLNIHGRWRSLYRYSGGVPIPSSIPVASPIAVSSPVSGSVPAPIAVAGCIAASISIVCCPAAKVTAQTIAEQSHA
jgi:hypothetical protein